MQFTSSSLVVATAILSYGLLAQSYTFTNSRFHHGVSSLNRVQAAVSSGNFQILQRSRGPIFCQAPSDSDVTEESDTGMEDEDNYSDNQYDDYLMADQPEDAEMIEAMRLERIIANDRWQSCLIRDRQAGEWTG